MRISDWSSDVCSSDLTREAGVRAVERLISKICRKVVKELLTSKDITRVDVTVDNLDKYLGVYQFRYGRAEEKNQIGQVTGLAWTEDRKSTRLNSSHYCASRMPSSA